MFSTPPPHCDTKPGKSSRVGGAGRRADRRFDEPLGMLIARAVASRWRAIWGGCQEKSRAGIGNDWDTSANKAIPYCDSFWWKRRRSRSAAIRSGAVSISIWPCDEDGRSPRSRWRADWRFVCTGCGVSNGITSSGRSSVRTRVSPEQALVCKRTPSNRLGSPLPSRGVRTSNHDRTLDRRDAWVGLSSPPELGLRANLGWTRHFFN